MVNKFHQYQQKEQRTVYVKPLNIKKTKTYHVGKNSREYRWDNQKWTIKRNWQQDEEKQNKNKNTTQYVLDTIMRKQAKIT